MEDLVPREQAFDLYGRTWRRVADQLEGLRIHPDAAVPHLDWTIGDLALHLVQATEVAGRLLEGESSPYTDMHRIGEVNEQFLAMRSDRDLSSLAVEFCEHAQRIESRFREMPDDFPVPFHGGMTFTPARAMAMMSCELLVHGWDIAQVTGQEYEVVPQDARLILHTVLPIMTKMVIPETVKGFVATYEVRIRGGATFRLHFEDEALQVSHVEPGGPADCRISVEPSSFLLMGYGRGSQITPVLTGKMVAWGRKPWLAMKFTRLVKSP